MKVKRIIIMLLILMTIPISGCSETSQLHQKLIVQGIGIDVEEDNYKVTLQAYDYQNPTAESEPTLKIIELSGNSIMEAFSHINRQTGLQPLYSQNMLIVFGEEVSKSGLSNVIDFFIRHYEVRPDVKICVAKGTAGDIMKCETNEGYVKVKDISDLVYDKCDVIHFVGRIRDGVSCPSVSVLKLQEDNGSEEYSIVSDGMACFKGDVLVGFSEEDQTKGIELINGDCIGKTYIVDMDNGVKVSCTIKKICKEIKPVISDTKINFDINLKVDAGVFEVVGQNIKSDMSISKYELEQKLSSYISGLSGQAINKVVMDYGTDIFRFGKILMNNNPNYFKSIENWEDVLKSATYNVNTASKITVSGTKTIF